MLWSQWWSEKLSVCHLLIWPNSQKYLLQNLNFFLINYSLCILLWEADGAKIQFDIFSNLLFVKIQVLSSLIFLIFDFTSFSAHICTESLSTTIHGRCASLFSHCLMGEVQWWEVSVSTNISWLRVCMKYLQGVRDWLVWFMITPSRLMWSYVNVQFWRNCSLAASRCIPSVRKLAKNKGDWIH